MDFKQIQELIKLINKSNIGEVTIEQDSFKITVKQKEDPVQNFLTAGAAPMNYAPQQTYVPPVGGGNGPAPVSDKPKTEATPDNLITIKSPMIGTFYRSSSPGKPQFVQVGDEIGVGSVVCIIEAMKLFNEIESEVKGKIVKVLVDDASPVEYDQPLFLVEP
ncbi:MAG: acetyl-CoA carboxylase biotin carboxyl carrier protein [Chitinophagaceae bacterium]|nr:MAG: acetyl-CoA carboxylase biotin carboxyl carrier protein [Chitinophagaceae bacterium]